MSSLNHDTFDESSHSFEDDVTGGGYAPPPQYTDFSDPHSVNNDDVFGGSNQEDPIFGEAANGPVFVESSNGPILPHPSEMQEEGSALREWRRQNAMILEQKEKREKEILCQIIEEANEYKTAFREKRKVTCQNNKTNNREKEKSFLANHEKFHKEADKSYWKAIAELIPNEVPTIEKKRGKKDQEKKPSVIVVQGPKPGKPADLARMRQILLKLKHDTPSHLKLAPPQAVTATKDGKTGDATADTPKPAAVASTQEAVAVA